MNLYGAPLQGGVAMVNRYGGPIGLAGKIIGLGKEEIEAGVPGWAWFGLGCLVGGAVIFAARGRLEKFAGAAS